MIRRALAADARVFIGFAAGLNGHVQHLFDRRIALVEGLGESLLTGTFVIMNAMSARSYHSGGLNLLSADGAVHWVASNVDLLIWKAAATPNGTRNSALPW